MHPMNTPTPYPQQYPYARPRKPPGGFNPLVPTIHHTDSMENVSIRNEPAPPRLNPLYDRAPSLTGTNPWPNQANEFPPSQPQVFQPEVSQPQVSQLPVSRPQAFQPPIPQPQLVTAPSPPSHSQPPDISTLSLQPRKRPTQESLAETPASYRKPPNGLDIPTELQQNVHRFRQIREDAVKDFQRFTPETQFKWAKLLLDSTNDDKLLSVIGVTGQFHPKPLKEKELRKQKETCVSTAIKILKKIPTNSSTQSEYELGNIYSGAGFSDLTEKNFDKAFQYFSRAAFAKNHPNAIYRVACCCEFGMGTKKDINKALELYDKAAKLGDVAAMCKLGIMHLKGLMGQRKNIEKALYWLNKASVVDSDESDVGLSLYILGKLHETDVSVLELSPETDPTDEAIISRLKEIKAYNDHTKAVKFYLKSAKMKYAKSQTLLANCYEYGTISVNVNAKKSIYWYSKAAQQDDPNAAMGLSGWYLTGSKGVLEQNDKEAYLWARKATEHGLARAEFALGYFSEHGIGSTKDMGEAKRWYKRAAAQGYQKAIKRLQDGV